MNRHEVRAQQAIVRKGQGRPLAGRGPSKHVHRGRRHGYLPNDRTPAQAST